MFSGIIETIGTVKEIRPIGKGYRLHVSSSLPIGGVGVSGVGTSDRERVGLGDSIAIFGVCLTVEELSPPDGFIVVCGQETLSASALGSLRPGHQVHLERATRLGDRMDGHIVQGHVDGVGWVVESYQAQESWVLWVKSPENLLKYIAVKGSVCLNGVSLTVNAVEGSQFRCNIIPHTMRETIFDQLQRGDKINIEIDVIARYVERMLQFDGTTKKSLTENRLRELGYGSPWSGGR